MPSGLWAVDEYEKLPRFDEADLTSGQPLGAFFCHQQNGRLCAGWVGCHDMDNSIGLRMALSRGLINVDDYEAAIDYESPVPLFSSGAEAAAHGMRDIRSPSPSARRAIDNLTRKRERKEHNA